jgi:hypothetical protein
MQRIGAAYGLTVAVKKHGYASLSHEAKTFFSHVGTISSNHLTGGYLTW